ncbi:hypothetical protein [Niabella drilacis]|uniref:Uncharacterized protein n=1 Tax=Niabella drilacis (strain DSM 25811 / CCM 8410 / CCUG 62505 / LMG 26954 / E90) TaxID=1285928 RepID=A0A1G6LGA2_NIADE|nr:hypothetical protein [Niabella drilacis]SDC42261.1 hypothetical protein SAMN04487894_102339 [Niabella drilacis]
MNQSDFSNIVKEFIIRSCPEFAGKILYYEDDSFDCELRSESDLFSIWIATYNCEITIGLRDPLGKSDIHTHIEFNHYDNEDFEDAFNYLKNFIERIKTEKLILVKKNDENYDWLDVDDFRGSIHSKISWKRN